MPLLKKYYFPPVHFWTLWFSEAMRYFTSNNGFELSDKTKALDVGCGLGYHCFTLSNLGLSEVTGVDISKDTMELLNEFHQRPTFLKLDICRDDITRFLNYFDIIFSSDVYEHVQDPQVMIDNIFKMLCQNGAACITFPNWDNHGQNQFSDKNQLLERFRKAGFSEINIDVIDNYSLIYRFFMKFYILAQKISDILFSIKRKQVKGTSMPESDEFHGMYAFQKIQKLKKHKLICSVINVEYSLLKIFLRISPPFIISNSDQVINKRIIVFAKR
jgi:2-polyprenyl-3-methyl-5-hydroxy-6-metoxy-1,4-benzoquinol methylase